jgi:hypothetical protein
VLISVVLNALFERHFFSLKGDVKEVPQHLMQNQLLKLLQQVMKGRYCQLLMKVNFALSFCAACDNISIRFRSECC